MTEDEMVGWHHQLNGQEFEQAPEVSDGRESLACCGPWDRKEADITERLKDTFHSPDRDITGGLTPAFFVRSLYHLSK